MDPPQKPHKLTYDAAEDVCVVGVPLDAGNPFQVMENRIRELEEKLQAVSTRNDTSQLSEVVSALSSAVKEASSKAHNAEQDHSNITADITKLTQQMASLSTAVGDVGEKSEDMRNVFEAMQRFQQEHTKTDKLLTTMSTQRSAMLVEAERQALKGKVQEARDSHPDDVQWKFSNTHKHSSYTISADSRTVSKMDDDHGLVFLDPVLPKANCQLRYQVEVCGDPEDATWTGFAILKDDNCSDEVRPDKKGIVYWWHVRYNQSKLVSHTDDMLQFESDFSVKERSVIKLCLTAVPHGHKLEVYIDEKLRATTDIPGASFAHRVGFVLSKGDKISLV